MATSSKVPKAMTASRDDVLQFSGGRVLADMVVVTVAPSTVTVDVAVAIDKVTDEPEHWGCGGGKLQETTRDPGVKMMVMLSEFAASTCVAILTATEGIVVVAYC